MYILQKKWIFTKWLSADITTKIGPRQPRNSKQKNVPSSCLSELVYTIVNLTSALYIHMQATGTLFPLYYLNSLWILLKISEDETLNQTVL